MDKTNRQKSKRTATKNNKYPKTTRTFTDKKSVLIIASSSYHQCSAKVGSSRSTAGSTSSKLLLLTKHLLIGSSSKLCARVGGVGIGLLVHPDHARPGEHGQVGAD